MPTIEDFKKAYLLFARETAVKPNSLWVKNEDNGATTLCKEYLKILQFIKQGNIPQTHMVEHLRELFTTGKLRAPRFDDHTYRLNSKEGHLPMIIAIVNDLKKLIRDFGH